MTEKKSFWHTIPGVITGAATIITALLGLIPLLNSGPDGDRQPAESASGTPTASGTSTAANRGSSGSATDSVPEALISPANVNFGRVGAGKTETQTVTVESSGSEYLVIEEAAISGRTEVFSAEADDCLDETGIEPGSQCEITVTFRPTSPGSYAGILEIRHSAKGSPERVALNGEGALLEL